MSDKQTAASNTAHYLRNAKISLASAVKTATATGDAKLTAAVTKLFQETTAVSNDLSAKRDPMAG